MYVSPYLNIGGTEKHIFSLIRFLKADHDITLAAPRGKMYEKFKELGIEIYDFPSFSGKGIFYGPPFFVRLLHNAARESKPDIVHVHAAAELLPLVKMAGIKVPLIFTCHGYTHGLDYFTSAFFCGAFAERVIVLSQAERKFFSKIWPEKDKIALIHNSAENMVASEEKVKWVKEKYNIYRGLVTIGTVGRLEKVKGVSLLIEAFSGLPEPEKEHLRLFIVGDGRERGPLQSLAGSLGLEAKVFFTGFVDSVANFLKAFDIYVSPSLKETFGTAILEAMSMGKAIVASDLEGTKEALGETGVFFKSGSAYDLRDKLLTLIMDASLRARMGDLAKARYLRNFRAEEMGRRVEGLYKDALLSS